MSDLQHQARALGDPTRHEIFRYVVDAERPVDVPELTDHLGLNHNAIRQHLNKLVEAELLVEGKAEATGPGRRRLVYTVDPRAESRWGVTGPYERLAQWLTEIVRTGESPVEIGRRVGRRQRLGRPAAVDPLAELADQMARHGFEPSVTTKGDEAVVVLHACPFVSTVLADPSTICELHLGLAQGMAETLEGIEVEELVPRDPRRANCRLTCRLTGAA